MINESFKICNRDRIRDEWQSYLQTIPWSCFCTFTTSKPITLNSARRLTEKISEKILPDGGKMFWAAERFPQGREGYHLHALVQTMYSPSQIAKWYDAHYGRVEAKKFNPKLGACGYVSKYMLKSAFDYDLLMKRAGKNLSLFKSNT
jgi:hypothetical protein